MNDQKKFTVVVLGGGIAGISVALELVRLGQEVALVEKTPFFGGRAAHLSCKATDVCQKCGVCLVTDRLKELFLAPDLRLYPLTELTQARRENGGFQLTFKRQPRIIDPYYCVDCGLCYDECPAVSQGAIIHAASPLNHPRYAVIPENCLFFQDSSCQVCQQVCPETVRAIDLTRPEDLLDLEASAVVMATGYNPADPCSRPHYGYGRLPHVVTGLELEEMLRVGAELKRPGDGGPVRHVAFIQCVGSRDQLHPYCSQVCCAYTLRLARLLKHRLPDSEVTTFYMDLQNIGRNSPQFQAEARRDVKMVRALPGDLREAPNGNVKLRYLKEDSGLPREAAFDLVVLSVGISPGEDNAALAALLQLELSPEGFFKAADLRHRSLTQQPGLFLAGTAEGPRDIAGCITQAVGTARQVSRYLQSKS
ncbi:MAG: FAD-dependent oxidoreductase [Desulfobaccales bacterium]